ncbi:MAG: alcohol dehydrogenase [Planctomycetes bacterium]|nr:alcohol dehydrogenase [Planctomycetota bacterium]
MRGLWIEKGRVVHRDDLEGPEPSRAGEVAVDVSLAGICATDLHLKRGYMGFSGVPGHEFCGVAREGEFKGRRVVGEINAGCGKCPACLKGLERHCPDRSVLGILRHAGAFAETLVLPEGNLHPIPEGLRDESAVFTEPLAAAFEIREQLDVDAFERRLVFGDGRLGLLCAQVLGLDGGEVSLIGRHPERSAHLPENVRHLGPAEPALFSERFDLVVEASGSPALLPRAMAATRPRGTLVLKTTAAVTADLDLAPLVVDEITLIGSRCGPFAPALEALATGRIVVTPWIDACMPLRDGPAAFELAARPGILKVLLDPREGAPPGVR